jgi:hypothetical protein
MKPQPSPIPEGLPVSGKVYTSGWFENQQAPEYVLDMCPYGQPGDRLWVRECFGYPANDKTRADIRYRADGGGLLGDWRPSIHMPRAASRITLEITGVRCEKLQDISEADAKAEGVTVLVDAEITAAVVPGIRGPAYLEYFVLWDSINGPGSWDANPYVWVVEFKRINPTNPTNTP